MSEDYINLDQDTEEGRLNILLNCAEILAELHGSTRSVANLLALADWAISGG